LKEKQSSSAKENSWREITLRKFVIFSNQSKRLPSLAEMEGAQIVITPKVSDVEKQKSNWQVMAQKKVEEGSSFKAVLYL
jgi:hypothetical protein